MDVEATLADRPVTANMLVTIACGLIVMLYAAKRYDTPDTNRLTTTKSLFFLTGAGYIAASLVIFFLLCEIVLKPGVLDFLGVEKAQEAISKFASPAVLSAVILTTMLPNVAVLSTADQWLLKRFQAWGHIPHGVRSIAETLGPDALPVSQDDIAKLRIWIADDGDTPNELTECIAAVPETNSRGLFTRVLVLYHEMQRLAALSAYAKAFRVHHEGWQNARDDFRVFAVQSQAFFLLFEQLRRIEGSAGEDALKQAADKYREICKRLYSQLTEILARLLIMTEGSEYRIQDRLRSMGFLLTGDTCPPIPVGPFLFLGVIMVLAILSAVAVVRPPPGGPMPLAITALLIGLTKAIGVLAAILPKFRWAAFRRDDSGRLPYLPWLASALGAALTAFIIERSSVAVLDSAASGAIAFGKYPLTPLAPTTFTLCLAMAIVCDVDLRLGNGWLRRISEGMLCGATMAVTIFVCLQLLNIESATAGQTWEWFPFAFSFCIGFVAGFVAPYLYRRARLDILPADDKPTAGVEAGKVTAGSG